MSKPTDLTKEEKTAIAALKRVATKWPKTLWLFSASGTLCVMKSDASGNRVMKKGIGTGFDPDYAVATIEGIENDGGDW